MRKRIRHDGRVPITFSPTVDGQSLIEMGGQGTLIKVLKSFSRQRKDNKIVLQQGKKGRGNKVQTLHDNSQSVWNTKIQSQS